MSEVSGRSGRLLLLFGLTSLAAVAVGSMICAASGSPASTWLRDLVAWAVGTVLAWLIAARSGPGAIRIALWAAPVGLAATLIGPGQQGVHRWIDLGPLHVNVAMTLLPAAVVALCALAERRLWPWAAAFLALGLLVVQPDASEAAALAAAIGLVAALAVGRRAVKFGLMLGAGLLATLAWVRPDPLQPVAEVEQILGLAFNISPFAAAVAVVILAGLAAWPVVLTRSSPPIPRLAGRGLGLCLLVWIISPFLGPFPVPLVGRGMSPIIGAWLGAGLLAGLMRRQDGEPPA